MSDEPEVMTQTQWRYLQAAALMDRDAYGHLSSETRATLEKIRDGRIVISEEEDPVEPEPTPVTMADPGYRETARGWTRPPYENATEKRLAEFLNEALDEIESMQEVLAEKIAMDAETAETLARLTAENETMSRAYDQVLRSISGEGL